MTNVRQIAAILLGAGAARRFGADKLTQPFEGEALGLRAARTLAGLGFGRLIAVTANDGVDYAGAGFEVVRNVPGNPMSSSLKLGVAAAAECEACLIALADMPLVPREHLEALIAAHEGTVMATLRNGRPMVPALFGRSEFQRLLSLSGDHGAQRLLAGARGVEARSEWLADVDTPADLDRLSR